MPGPIDEADIARWVVGQLLPAMTDSAAAEKLLEALLHAMAAQRSPKDIVQPSFEGQQGVGQQGTLS